MKIIEFPKHEIIWQSNTVDMFRIAEGAHVCYQSERRDKNAERELISRCFKNGHHSVLEHSSMTVRFTCDRGVSHELVRHRLASFSQESTRYCNYSKDKFGREISVVKPVLMERDSDEYCVWKKQCESAEKAYFDLLDLGVKPENARSVLPTSLKTEIIVTTNLREWFHILELRTARDAQPDIRWMMHCLLLDISNDYMEIFGDLLKKRNHEFFIDFVKKGEE